MIAGTLRLGPDSFGRMMSIAIRSVPFLPSESTPATGMNTRSRMASA
jgi:hypothetical protein